MAGVASGWSQVSLHVKLKSATRLPAIERISPTVEEVFSSPDHFVKDKAGCGSSDFQNTYQIYPLVTGQFITTRYLIVLHKSVN